MDRVLTVATFAHDGSSLRRHSLDAALRLEQQKKAKLQRSASGEILSVRYLLGGRSPQNRLIHRLKMGTKYSFREHVGTGYPWTLKRLPYGAIEAQLEFLAQPEEVDGAIRDLFSAVLLSVGPESCKVVSIDSFRFQAKEIKGSLALQGAA